MSHIGGIYSVKVCFLFAKSLDQVTRRSLKLTTDSGRRRGSIVNLHGASGRFDFVRVMLSGLSAVDRSVVWRDVGGSVRLRSDL